MNDLDKIIKNQMISSLQNNITFKHQLTNVFNSYYTQNIKYHVLWLFFHSFSFAYPDSPSDEFKIETANLLMNIIPKNLTSCGSCQNDYKTFIEKLNIYRVVSSKYELSNFFVDLHNYINNKKFQLTTQHVQYMNASSKFIFNLDSISNNEATFINYSTVKNKYDEIDYVYLLETKFNINMFTLIEEKKLSSFYDLFNKIKFDSISFNVAIEIL